MNSEQKELIKSYIFEAKNLISERMSGDIKEMTFRQLDKALEVLDKRFSVKEAEAVAKSLKEAK